MLSRMVFVVSAISLAVLLFTMIGCGGRQKQPGHSYWEDSPGAVSRLEPVGPRWSLSNFNAWPGNTFDMFMQSHPFKDAAKQGISINRQDPLWEKYGGERFVKGLAVWPTKSSISATIDEPGFKGHYWGYATEFRVIIQGDVFARYGAVGGSPAHLVDSMRLMFYETMNKDIGPLRSYAVGMSTNAFMRDYEMKHVFAYNCGTAIISEISKKTGLLKDPAWVERIYVDPDLVTEPYTQEAYDARIQARKRRMMTNPGDIGPEPILIPADALEHFRAWSKANPNDWSGKPSDRDDTFTYEIK